MQSGSDCTGRSIDMAESCVYDSMGAFAGTDGQLWGGGGGGGGGEQGGGGGGKGGGGLKGGGGGGGG